MANEKNLKPFKKGNPGRPKGSKNKLTTNIKTAFLKAFEDMGGGEELAKWGKKPQNRGDFYKMIAKMLPAQITFDEESPLHITINKKIVNEEKGCDEN